MATVPNLDKPQQPLLTVPTGRGMPPADMDPFADTGAYLRAKGWKPLGPLNSAITRWLDPDQPLSERYDDVQLWVEKPDDANPGEIVKTPFTCAGPNGTTVSVRQRRYTAAVTPMDVGMAMLIQLKRDQNAQEQAAKDRVAAAKEKAEAK